MYEKNASHNRGPQTSHRRKCVKKLEQTMFSKARGKKSSLAIRFELVMPKSQDEDVLSRPGWQLAGAGSPRSAWDTKLAVGKKGPYFYRQSTCLSAGDPCGK